MNPAPPQSSTHPASQHVQDSRVPLSVLDADPTLSSGPSAADVDASARPEDLGFPGIETEGAEPLKSSDYWDAETMAPLNVASRAAIARLRRYVPPTFPLWDRLPASRRSAVLVLLYADRRGDLRVVLTMRAASLRTFSGHAAFPGGKADSLEESPYQTARREAWEEIGLPQDDAKLPSPFRIEFLCHLPHSLARTDLVVRPCVALLHTDGKTAPPKSPASAPTSPPSSTESTPEVHSPAPLVEDIMRPRLAADEVAAVFSAPFENFLRASDLETETPLPEGHWYDGYWLTWLDHPWRVHNFYVPINDQNVARPAMDVAPPVETSDTQTDVTVPEGRYRVWGLTAKMLVEAASIAYDQEPEFEHNENQGDEILITIAEKQGRMFDKAKKSKSVKGAGEVDESASYPSKGEGAKM